MRRIAVAVAGFAVLALGLALVVVPVPGTTMIVVPLGLAILAKEFTWAERVLGWSLAAVRRVWARVKDVFGRGPARLAPVPSF
jgi:hypothetical protein